MTKELVRFRRLAFVVVVATLLLTTLGALVRATGSGLGCLDEWPRCAGGWIAPLEYHALIEYSHRAVAVIVVVLVLVSIPAARRWVRSSGKIFALALTSFGVVIGQALLGMVVVRSGLHGALVSAHFTLALALVGATTWMASEAHALSLGRPRSIGPERRMFRSGLGALAGLLPLLGVGAYVREKG